MAGRMAGGLAAALLAVAAPTAAADPRVAFTRDLGGPVALPAACPAQDSDAWPVLGADPRRPDRLRGVVQRGGVEAVTAVFSGDGGRTWTIEPLADATRCSGGPAERQFSVNPLLAVGAGGIGYHGQSWVRLDHETEMGYGVAVHALGSGRPGTSPDGDTSSQNAAVVAGRRRPGRIGLLWTDLDQVPNPFTYAPAGSRVHFARSDDGGTTWEAPAVVHAPGPGDSVVNTRIVRTGDGVLVAIWDIARNADLPGAILGVGDVSFTLFTARSEDWGATWSAPVEIGTHGHVVAPDPDHQGGEEAATYAISAKPSLAAGPGGRVAVTVAGRTDAEDRSAVRLATSRDSGLTWTEQADAFTVAGQLIQPEAAFDSRGRLGVAFYDFAADTPGDEAGWETTPRAAVRRKGTWSTVALASPFDLHETNRCTNTQPFGSSCELTVDAMAIGVYPSITGLRRGFGIGYSVGPPLARDGFTDARFARLRP